MSASAVSLDAPAVPQHALGYRALKLWQRALDLAADAHRLARAFPEADQPALAADFRRAAAGVPAAIAASALALDAADQHRALQAATAALARVETLAALAERAGALAPADATSLLFTSGDVHRLLRGFVRSIAARTRLDAPRAAATSADASAPALAVAERPVDAGSASSVAPTPDTPAAPAAPPSMRSTTRRRAAAVSKRAP